MKYDMEFKGGVKVTLKTPERIIKAIDREVKPALGPVPENKRIVPFAACVSDMLAKGTYEFDRPGQAMMMQEIGQDFIDHLMRNMGHDPIVLDKRTILLRGRMN